MAKRVSVDRWLFTVTMLLVFVGLVMVFSASAVMARERFGSPYAFLLKQLIWAAAGLVVMVVAGPTVLFNNAAKSWREKSCSGVAFGLAAALAGYWSFAIGLLVVQVALAL